MESPTKHTHLPRDLSTEILARLPLRSISRFKSVCKTWKSITESVFFRHLFVSLHKLSSSSWSVISPQFSCKEYIGLYGCKTWDLPKSIASYFPPPSPAFPDLRKGYFAYSRASNGLVLMEGSGYGCFVGNPVLEQWVQIPPCPYISTRFDFVTRVDEDGVVLSFKVLRLKKNEHMDMCMYSSETGIWTSKKVHIPSCHVLSFTSSLSGLYYFLAGGFRNDEPGEVIAHDFYSESDQFRAIPLPDHLDYYDKDFKRALTTSRGYLMYIKTLARKGDNVLKVWRLNNVGLEDECWQLLCETPLPFIQSDIGSFAPMAMHPFDSDIVYIWNQQNGCVVSCNLRTQNYRMLRYASNSYNDDCFMNQSICQKSMNYWIYEDDPDSDYRCGTYVALSHFVLPRWMGSIPCPPHVEMIDTAALLSYIASVQKTKRDTGEGKKVH